jgi:hypothetical protein
VRQALKRLEKLRNPIFPVRKGGGRAIWRDPFEFISRRTQMLRIETLEKRRS